MNKILILLFSILISNHSFSGDLNFLENSSSRCQNSLDGSSVSCGGQTSRCQNSLDGSSVSCGGSDQ